ncbi:GGDEF domain-containing phosphodiesterase [Noviherbaspirillum denitrificans]|uniref:Diguanylate cyclase n=1 Tax=Noviherbaspirillum denitrificans TaxID=1968433 RepID=A0A254T720_9BURK|nr:GGDEF domain-containing phosphodiesterase [Noviherbaspirillum denitrificans]OWW18444.1 hypothetical protein AYR66_00370 [Noviherbaspirillum denitrificans]
MTDSAITTRSASSADLQMPGAALSGGPGCLVSAEMARLAAFARWSFEIRSQVFALNHVAREFMQLGDDAGPGLDAFCTHVVPDDVPELLSALHDATRSGQLDRSFRLVTREAGVRWYRMVSSGADSTGTTLVGALLDITDVKHGQLREQILFESTQYLIGFSSLESAVRSVIRVVCENLGWEWGAYWSFGSDRSRSDALSCTYYWHVDSEQLEGFSRDSLQLQMRPGEGLVGKTWKQGGAAWIDDIADDAGFLRRHAARSCGLHGGFAFAVAFVDENGVRHSPGVLEFYSSMTGKRECQLPHLSAAIGAFIAQSAHRHLQNRQIREFVEVDDLSGVIRRPHFMKLMEAACGEARAHGSELSLLYVRLHRVRKIGEVFGPQASERLLGEFGKRLRMALPGQLVVGRVLAGDFTVLVPANAALPPLPELASTIYDLASSPIDVGDHVLTTSASVSSAQFPRDALGADELLKIANARVGGGGAMPSGLPLIEQMAIETGLRAALEQDQLTLEYQPIFDADHGVAAIEALVRWRRPSGEIVSPDVFIPVAESSGLIAQLDRWVMAHAIRDVGSLRGTPLASVQVNINITADELLDPGLSGRLTSLALEHQVDCERICLELTERSMMTDPQRVQAVMTRLRALGFKISIDDFGTGYSSLSRIMSLPVTSIKMDRMFVRGLPDDTKSGAIVRTILGLGKHSQLPVVAEGVENERQALYLLQFGCSHFQGYLFGRPAPLDQLLDKLSMPSG